MLYEYSVSVSLGYQLKTASQNDLNSYHIFEVHVHIYTEDEVSMNIYMDR